MSLSITCTFENCCAAQKSSSQVQLSACKQPTATSQISRLLAQNQIKAALRIVNAELETHPRDPELYWYRALCLRKFRATCEPAVEDLDRAIALSPNKAKYYITKAEVCYQLEEDERSLRAAQIACKLSPTSGDAWDRQALSLCRLARLPEALACTNRAIELGPTNGMFHQRKARVLIRLRQWKPALVELNLAAKLNPESQATFFQDRILVNKVLENWQSVADDANVVINHGHLGLQFLVEVLRSQAQAFTKLHRYAEAKKSLKRAIQIAPFSRPAYQELVQVCEYDNDSAELAVARKAMNDLDRSLDPPF